MTPGQLEAHSQQLDVARMLGLQTDWEEAEANALEQEISVLERQIQAQQKYAKVLD